VLGSTEFGWRVLSSVLSVEVQRTYISIIRRGPRHNSEPGQRPGDTRNSKLGNVNSCLILDFSEFATESTPDNAIMPDWLFSPSLLEAAANPNSEGRKQKHKDELYLDVLLALKVVFSISSERSHLSVERNLGRTVSKSMGRKNMLPDAWLESDRLRRRLKIAKRSSHVPWNTSTRSKIYSAFVLHYETEKQPSISNTLLMRFTAPAIQIANKFCSARHIRNPLSKYSLQ